MPRFTDKARTRQLLRPPARWPRTGRRTAVRRVWKGVDQYQSEKDSLFVDHGPRVCRHPGVSQIESPPRSGRARAHRFGDRVAIPELVPAAWINRIRPHPDREQLYQRVVDQKKYVQNLIDLMSDMKDIPVPASLLNDLKGIAERLRRHQRGGRSHEEKLATLQQSVTTVREQLGVRVSNRESGFDTNGLFVLRVIARGCRGCCGLARI